MGSFDARTAAAPPSHRRLRTAGSMRRVRATSRAASESGASTPSSRLTYGSSGPSHSRIRSSENESVSRSTSGYTGLAAHSRCFTIGSSESAYSRSRRSFGFARSAVPRTRVLA